MDWRNRDIIDHSINKSTSNSTSEIAINAGRDAAALFRSLCQTNRTAAVRRAERLINAQCPFSDLHLAAAAFNKEVDRVVALIESLDQSLGRLPDQSFGMSGSGSNNNHFPYQKQIALLDQVAQPPPRFCGQSLVSGPPASSVNLRQRPILKLLEKTLKLLHA